jgi:glycosyltransferase involved in cell wall biosynthesis
MGVPAISVLLPVHKVNPFLQEALDSILTQTFEDFELLFLDNSVDGVTEHVWNIDPRILHVKLSGKFGLSESLNAGMEIAKGKYLARMDFDDVSLPDRFQRQFDFLETNPWIAIAGGGIEIIGAEIDLNATPGQLMYRPSSSEEILYFLLNKNPLFHPTVMMRTSSMKKNKLFYNKKYDAAEDLELWVRASHKVAISNLSDVVLKYRLHSNQFSREDGTNSQYQASIARMRHALWMATHKRKKRLSSIKTLIVNFNKFRKLYFLKRSEKNFKKF